VAEKEPSGNSSSRTRRAARLDPPQRSALCAAGNVPRVRKPKNSDSAKHNMPRRQARSTRMGQRDLTGSTACLGVTKDYMRAISTRETKGLGKALCRGWYVRAARRTSSWADRRPVTSSVAAVRADNRQNCYKRPSSLGRAIGREPYSSCSAGTQGSHQARTWPAEMRIPGHFGLVTDGSSHGCPQQDRALRLGRLACTNAHKANT